MKPLPLGTSPDDEVAANERFKIAKLLVEAHAAANEHSAAAKVGASQRPPQQVIYHKVDCHRLRKNHDLS